MMRIAYWDHVEKIISPMNESGENWTGMKKFWQFIKSMRKDYMGVPALKDKGMTVIDSRAKADLLNKQFESVFILGMCSPCFFFFFLKKKKKKKAW